MTRTLVKMLVVFLICVTTSLLNDVQAQRPTRQSGGFRPSRPSRECQAGDTSRLPCTECVCNPSGCMLETNFTDCFDSPATDIDICQISGDTRADDCVRCQCDIQGDGRCTWEFDPSLEDCNVVDPQFPSLTPPGFGGGSCEVGDVSRVPCVECVCNSTGCFWMFNYTTCGIPDLPDFREPCEAGDGPRTFPVCETCMCDTDGMCFWTKDMSLDKCGGDCSAEEMVQCFVDPCRFSICPANRNATCVADYCDDCSAEFYDSNGMEVDCFNTDGIDCESGEPSECFRDPCTYTKCIANPDAKCVSNYCDGCKAEFYDENGEEIKCFGSDDDDEDEDRCKPGARPPIMCRDCVCLNDDCGRCTGKDKCEWYDNPRECRGDEGDIDCPGNRPFSPCGEVDPCELIGECVSNPDLECKKFECSRCQARFYNAEGFPEECPVMEKKVCSVPGRGRSIKIGVTIDDPRDPCQLCVCGSDGDLECTEDRECGKQRRFKVSFDVANCTGILSNPDRREDFIDMFINTLAMKANISTAFIKDVLLSCGSIVAETTVVESSPGDPNSVDVDATVSLIENGVKDGDIVIDLDGEMFESIPDSFNQVGGKASTFGTNLVVVTVLAVIAALWI